MGEKLPKLCKNLRWNTLASTVLLLFLIPPSSTAAAPNKPLPQAVRKIRGVLERKERRRCDCRCNTSPDCNMCVMDGTACLFKCWEWKQSLPPKITLNHFGSSSAGTSRQTNSVALRLLLPPTPSSPQPVGFYWGHSPACRENGYWARLSTGPLNVK